MLRNFILKNGLAILALTMLMLTTKSVFSIDTQGLMREGVNASFGTGLNRITPTNTTYEDFEGDVFPPEGWTIFSLLDNSQSWELNYWQNHTPGGTQSAFHNYTSGEESVDNWLVTPQINIGTDGFHHLSFWSYLGNGWSYKKNSVLISTGSPNPADGDYVEKWAGISNDGWMWAHFFINLEDYVGEDVYIAFRYEGDQWGHTWNVDDVALVDESPFITISSNEVSQNVGLNGAGVKFIEIGNAGILDLTYDIEIEYINSEGWLTVNPISGSVASQTTMEVTLTFDATGLEVGTYQALLNITSNDLANSPVSVVVVLNVVDVNVYPFVENFESESFPPIGWTSYDIDGDQNEWVKSWYNNTPGGQYSAYHGYSWSPQDGWFVTPQITVPAEGFFYLSFWSLVGDAAWYGKNSVLVSTGSGNPNDGDFVEVWTVQEVAETWTQYFINLEAYAGQDIFFAFRYEGEYAHYWIIDDISLGEEIDDSPVMNISTSQVNQTVGQNGTGTKSFKVINDGIQNLTFEIAIDFINMEGWLEVNPLSGSIPAKSSQTITLSFDAVGLEIGTYLANIIISSNDSDNPTATVVATLNVMEAQPVNLTIIYPEYTYPTAISSDGRYVSGSQFGGKNSYQWTLFSGTIDFLGEGLDITDNGFVVGTYETGFTYEGMDVGTAGIWNRATQQWQFLGINPEVPEFFGPSYNTAYGITADGSTVVGMQWYADWTVKAYKWTEADGYQMIGASLPYNTRANGISANGNVIYGWAEPNWTRTPVIWYNDEIIFIDEYQYGEASGASASGNYVTGNVGEFGFIWSPTEGISLFQNTLNSGFLSPSKVLDDGTVFGYIAEGFPPTPDTRRAFVRHPDGTMETFNEYVASRGWFDASDWIFFSVNDVTPDGNKFIGAAELPTGQWISFMLDLEPGTPTIEVTPLSISETLNVGETSVQTLNISNVGDGYLQYNALVQYTVANPEVKQVPVGENFVSRKLSFDKKKISGNIEKTVPKSAKSTTLNYDGDNIDAIGLTAGGTFYAATRFPSELTSIFESYQLETVDVFIGDIPTQLKLMIWGAGTTTSAGTLLHEQIFTPSQASWNTIILDSPIEISGDDIWVGLEITHDAGLYVMGIDGGPATPNGDWLSQDATSWEHLSDYGLNSNWNIRANLSFNGLNWLSIGTTSGIIEGQQSDEILVFFNSEGLEIGAYTANIRISSNDTENPLIIIPISLEVTEISSYNLTLIVNPENAGVVTGEGQYNEGQQVLISAQPNEGFEFTNWTIGEDVISIDASFNYTMPATDITLTANFSEVSPQAYFLTLLVNPEEAGSVIGAGEYEEGTVVAISALANYGFTFMNWTNEAGDLISELAEFEVTVNEDLTLIANFEVINSVDVISENGLLIYPNPSNGIVNIVSQQEIIKYQIYNMQGQMLSSENVNMNRVQFDANGFSGGIYFIRIYTLQGVYTQRLQVVR